MPVGEMLAKRPKAIILSGGPSSVYADGAPPAPDGLFDAGVPVLGICYGFQLMVAGLGGTVERTGAAEYGATVLIRGDDPPHPPPPHRGGPIPPRPPLITGGNRPPRTPLAPLRGGFFWPARRPGSASGCRTGTPRRPPRPASRSRPGPTPPRWPRWRTPGSGCSACSSTPR